MTLWVRDVLLSKGVLCTYPGEYLVYIAAKD